MTAPDPFQIAYPMLIRPDRCTDDSFCYLAEHPDLPGCAAHGDTIKEAKELLAQARVAYLKHVIAKGEPLPIPSRYRPSEWLVANPTPPAASNWTTVPTPNENTLMTV